MRKPESKCFIEREIHEHEVFLSFDSDEDAEHFSDWWNAEGWNLFHLWVKGEKP